MTEIAVHADAALPAKIEWARTMATANLLPQQYRNNPGNLLYAVEYADSLGIDRINAITSIHVINGKPTASADLIASLVRKAGHKLRVTGDDVHATAQIIRADDPEFTYEATWDVKKAQSAGLWGKGNWKNYPGAMLKARAITEVARMGASDALFGVVYTPEELGAEVAERQADAPASARDRLSQAAAATVPDDAPHASAEPPISDEQRKILHALVNELGLSRDQKIEGVRHYVGRPVESTSDLSKAEASKVIDALQAKVAERNVADAGGEVIDAEVVEDALPIEADQ